MLPEKLQFLTAPRFWAMIVGAVSVYAQAKGWIGDAEMKLIATMATIFIGVQTVDRVTDKIANLPNE